MDAQLRRQEHEHKTRLGRGRRLRGWRRWGEGTARRGAASNPRHAPLSRAWGRKGPVMCCVLPWHGLRPSVDPGQAQQFFDLWVRARRLRQVIVWFAHEGGFGARHARARGTAGRGTLWPHNKSFRPTWPASRNHSMVCVLAPGPEKTVI